eukprot:10635131-Alexandrium_andersonii.AAC.1
MSASLVGSEMCIRDRDWSMRVGEFATSDPLKARFRGQLRDLREQRRRTCLLYTSDAADDSSV